MPNPTPFTQGNKSVFIGLVSIIRPRQWVKNTFVLAPLVFSGQFMHTAAIIEALTAMGLFCIASSIVYIINDTLDITEDKKHPIKSQCRPLASGELGINSAMILLAGLTVILAFAYWSRPNVMHIVSAYIILNVAYSVSLKNIAIVDIFTIASGFVLRVYAGALALDVPVSSWMFVTTLCLALFLASIKRRQEINHTSHSGRIVLGHYTSSLLEKYAQLSATGALLFYSLFVMTVRTELVVSIPLVLFGIFRYWYIVEQRSQGESPTDTFINDWPLLITVALWGGLCIFTLLPSGANG